MRLSFAQHGPLGKLAWQLAQRGADGRTRRTPRMTIPEPPRAELAAIDIGTNTTRLLVVDAAGQRTVERATVTQLGQDVDRTGLLREDAMARTLRVLSDYAQLVATRAVERLRAVTTSAARDARNGDEFVRRASSTLGAPLEILSGDAEARLSYRGATRHLTDFRSPCLVVDIGGGSTELVVGDADEVLWARSLNVGSVRVTERFLHALPPTRAQLEAAASWIDAQLAEAGQPNTSAPLAVGVAGTATSVAALAAGLAHYRPGCVHGFSITPEALASCHERLSEASLAKRRELLLEPSRAETVVGGTLILQRVMRAWDLRSIVASERDLLDGLIASLRSRAQS